MTTFEYKNFMNRNNPIIIINGVFFSTQTYNINSGMLYCMGDGKMKIIIHDISQVNDFKDQSTTSLAIFSTYLNILKWEDKQYLYQIYEYCQNN